MPAAFSAIVELNTHQAIFTPLTRGYQALSFLFSRSILDYPFSVCQFFGPHFIISNHDKRLIIEPNRIMFHHCYHLIKVEGWG